MTPNDNALVRLVMCVESMSLIDQKTVLNVYNTDDTVEWKTMLAVLLNYI